MSDELSLIIKSKLDDSQQEIASLNRQLSSIEDRINKLNIKVVFDDKAISGHMHAVTQEVDKTQRKIAKTYAKPIKINTQLTGLNKDELEKSFRAVRQGVQEISKIDIRTNKNGKITSALVEYRNETGQLVQETLKWTEYLDKANNTVKKIFQTTGFRFVDDLVKARKEAEKANKELEKLAFAMAKVREQSDIRKANENKQLELNQAKAINKAQEDNAKAELARKKEIADVTELIALYQQEMQIKSANDLSAYSKHMDTKAFSNVLEKVNGLNPSDFTSLEEYKQAVARINLEYKEIINNARILRRENTLAMREADTFGKTLVKDFGKMVAWTIVGTALFGTLRQLQEGIKYLNELDKALTDIRIVTGQSQEEVTKLAQSYNKLGKEMSVSTGEIAKTAADLFRQGLSGNDVEERMKSIITYAKISSLSLEDSNKIITATANATGQSVQKIVDVFAILGDTTASGAEEIGEALQRVASASENSNISLEKSASWLATISSVTRESASTIGRSLNSIISRYESIKAKGFNEDDATKINDVTKALAKIGVNSSVNGQLRDLTEIMDEVGAKWETLTKNEKAYIATTMAGTYQRNRFITLMNNYDDSLKNYETALNSAGVAEQKFGVYQESTAAKLDKLKTAWESFWQSTISSDFIKGTIDVLTLLMNTLGNLGTMVLGLATAFTIWKGASIIPFLTKTIASINMYKTGVAIATEETGLFTVVTKEAAASTSLLQGAFTRLGLVIKTNPIGAIATAIMIAVSAFEIFNGKLDESAQKEKEAFEKNVQAVQQLQKETAQIPSLISQYEALSSSTVKTAEEKQKLADVQQKLIALFPEAVSGYDAEGNAILGNISLVKQLAKAKEDELKIKQQELSDKFATTGDKAFSSLQDDQKTLQELLQKRQDTLQRINDIKSGDTSPVDLNGNNLLEGYNNELDNLNKKISDLHPKIQQQTTDFVNMAFAFSQTDDTLKSLDKGVLYNFSVALSKSGTEVQDFHKKLTQLANTGFGREIETERQALEDMAKAGEDSSTIQNQLASDIEQNFVPALVNLGWKAEDAKSFLSTLFDIPSPKEATDGINSANDSLSKYQETLASSSKAIASVREAIDGYNESGKFNIDTIISLAKEYPQLLQSLDDEKELRTELDKIIHEEQEASRTAYTQMLMDSEDFYKNKILLDNNYSNSLANNVNSIFENYHLNYELDLKNFKSLAEAKQKVDLELIKRLASSWSKYYNAQGQFTGHYIDGGRTVVSDAAGHDEQYLTPAMRAEKQALEEASARAKAAFDSITTDFSSGVDFSSIGMSKSNKSTSEPETSAEADILSARIRSFNYAVEQDKLDNESLKKKIDIAKQAKNYNDELKYTNELIAGQRKELNDIYEANSKIEAEKASVKAQFSFDTSNWFDSNGLATVAYEEAYQNASAKTQKEMSKEFDALEKLNKAWNDNNQNIQEVNDTMVATALSLIEIQKAIDDLNFDKISKDYADFADKFQQKLGQLDFIDMFIKDTDLEAKTKVIKDKMSLTLSQISAIQEKIKSIESMDISKTQKEDLFKEWSQDLSNAVSSYASLEQALAANAQNKLNVIKDVEKTIVDMIRQQYQEEMKLEDANHNRKLKNLNEEKQAYDEIIKAKMDSLDLEKETNDYNDSLNQLQEERNSLQQQYDSLLMDSSYSAEIQRGEIQKAIQNKDKELQDKIYQHGIDYRKKNLQDELDTFNDLKDNEIESENDSYDNYKNIMEQKMQDENLYFEARNKLSNESTQSLINDLVSYTDQFGEGMSLLGDSIKENLIDNLKLAVKELGNIPALLDEINSSNSSNPTVDKAVDTINNKPSYTGRRKVYGNDIDLASAIEVLGTKNFEYINNTSPDPSQLTSQDIVVGGSGVFTNWDDLQKVRGLTMLYGQDRDATKQAIIDWKSLHGYKTGGVVDYTGLAQLHGSPANPEVIFNATDASKLFNFVKNIPSSLASLFPQFRVPSSSIPAKSGTEVKEVSVNLTVQGNLDKSVLPEVKTALSSTADKLKKELNKLGVYKGQ